MCCVTRLGVSPLWCNHPDAGGRCLVPCSRSMTPSSSQGRYIFYPTCKNRCSRLSAEIVHLASESAMPPSRRRFRQVKALCRAPAEHWYGIGRRVREVGPPARQPTGMYLYVGERDEASTLERRSLREAVSGGASGWLAQGGCIMAYARGQEFVDVAATGMPMLKGPLKSNLESRTQQLPSMPRACGKCAATSGCGPKQQPGRGVLRSEWREQIIDLLNKAALKRQAGAVCDFTSLHSLLFPHTPPRPAANQALRHSLCPHVRCCKAAAKHLDSQSPTADRDGRQPKPLGTKTSRRALTVLECASRPTAAAHSFNCLHVTSYSI